MICVLYPGNMQRAQLEIVLRNGQTIGVGFDDDEVVNGVIERLKKALLEENGLFSLEMTNTQAVPPTQIVHYVPTREIVRFAIVQFPRTTVVTPR